VFCSCSYVAFAGRACFARPRWVSGCRGRWGLRDLADASRLARKVSALARQVADLQDSPVLAGLGPDFPAPSAGTGPAVDFAEPQLMSHLERRLGRMLREELRGQLRLELRNLGIEPLAPR